MDQLMHEVFEVIYARGRVTREDAKAFILASDNNTTVALYEDHLVSAVNDIEGRVLVHMRDAPRLKRLREALAFDSQLKIGWDAQRQRYGLYHRESREWVVHGEQGCGTAATDWLALRARMLLEALEDG